MTRLLQHAAPRYRFPLVLSELEVSIKRDVLMSVIVSFHRPSLSNRFGRTHLYSPEGLSRSPREDPTKNEDSLPATCEPNL